MDYNMLSEINPTKYNWRVKVRAARIWQISGNSKGKEFSSMELILVDEEVHQLACLICFRDIFVPITFTLSILFYRA
jgi:hypothetical protein